MLDALGERLAALDELAMSEIKMRVVSGTHWVDKQLRVRLHPELEERDVTVVAVNHATETTFTLVAANQTEVNELTALCLKIGMNYTCKQTLYALASIV